MVTRVALNSLVLPADSPVPDWVDLVPAGTVTGRDGRGWVNDAPDAIVDAFNASGVDLPLDVEHATELKAPQGEPAPAAGWIKELQAQNGVIRGRVEWTTAGRELVSTKAYRYISPVIVYERSSNRITQLTSVGLTNRPNLRLPALNHEQQQEDVSMSMNAAQFAMLLSAFGLSATATAEQAINHAAKLQGDLATAMNSAANPPLDKFVPKADYDLVVAKATNAEQKLADQAKAALETAINAEIDTALKAGKITPATVEYHKASCRQEGGLDRFKAFCQAAPVLVPDSGLDTKKPEDTATALNADEQYVCKALGISETDFIATKKGA